MDLLSSRPMREGSRGGRAEFSWEAVKADKDRENYLGHSLMAPVGRWQQGRDLTWYAKDKSKGIDEERQKRLEEIRKIKEAEEDALAAALGLPVKIRRKEEPLVSHDEIKRVVGNVGSEEEMEGRGIGFGKGEIDAGDWRDGREYEKVRTNVENGGFDFKREKAIGRHKEMDSSSHERGDAKYERRRGDEEKIELRERERPRWRRDTSRSRDQHRHRERSRSRERYREVDRKFSRRHYEDRSRSPPSRRRSRSKSRSRSRSRVRHRDRVRDRHRDRVDDDRDYDRSFRSKR